MLANGDVCNAGFSEQCISCPLSLYCIGNPPDRIWQCVWCGRVILKYINPLSENYEAGMIALLSHECPWACEMRHKNCEAEEGPCATRLIS